METVVKETQTAADVPICGVAVAAAEDAGSTAVNARDFEDVFADVINEKQMMITCYDENLRVTNFRNESPKNTFLNSIM